MLTRLKSCTGHIFYFSRQSSSKKASIFTHTGFLKPNSKAFYQSRCEPFSPLSIKIMNVHFFQIHMYDNFALEFHQKFINHYPNYHFHAFDQTLLKNLWDSPSSGPEIIRINSKMEKGPHFHETLLQLYRDVAALYYQTV